MLAFGGVAYIESYFPQRDSNAKEQLVCQLWFSIQSVTFGVISISNSISIFGMWVSIFRCIYIFLLTYEIGTWLICTVIGFSNDNVTFKVWYNISFYQPLSSSPFCFLKHSLNSCQAFQSSSIRYAEDSNLILWFWGTKINQISSRWRPKASYIYNIDTGCETPQEHHHFLRPFIGAKPMCQNTIGSGQTSPSDRRIWRTHAWRNGIHAALVEVEHQIWLKMIFLTILQGPQHHFSAAFFGCFCPRTFVGLFRLAAF